MSDYGLSFGFRSSSETLRMTEGRYKTAAGSALIIGTMVEPDLAAPGFLKQSPTNLGFVPKFRGLLLQELVFENSVFGTDPAGIDSYAKGIAKPVKLSVITSGAGTKIWLKNIASATRADGRVIAARTMYTSAGSLVVGDSIAWNGTIFCKVGQSSTTVAVATVTALNSTTGLLEAVLLG